MYHHVTRDHRIALSALLRAGHSRADAARNLGVHRSTITREIRRNARIDGYHAGHANRLGIKRRRSAKLNARKIENDSALQAMIIELLHPLCSPETVAHEVGIAHASIYAWIERSRPDMRIRLPYRGKKRRRMIDHSPAILRAIRSAGSMVDCSPIRIGQVAMNVRISFAGSLPIRCTGSLRMTRIFPAPVRLPMIADHVLPCGGRSKQSMAARHKRECQWTIAQSIPETIRFCYSYTRRR